MKTSEMVAALDAEIDRLRKVRDLLSEAQAGELGMATTRPALAGAPTKVKRVLSPEARERIAAAQRARWAARNG